MEYYVYYSYENFGRGYIGCRKCKCEPEQDVTYFGSFRDKTFKPTEKIILETFPTYELALECEVKLHKFFNVSVNPHFANIVRQTCKRFTTEGSTLVIENNRKVQNELVENNKHHFQNSEFHKRSYKLKQQKGTLGNGGKVGGSLPWWTNTKTGKTTRSKTHPGKNWEKGRNFTPTNLLKYRQSEEGKRHNREKCLGTKWWNNGTQQKQSKESPGMNWKLGRLPFRKK